MDWNDTYYGTWKEKYGYEYMVHLSMVLKLSSQPPIEKHRFLSANGKTTYKSPDLIAINNSNRYYGVFESKVIALIVQMLWNVVIFKQNQ